MKLFAKQGYEGTTIDDIGAAVRLTGPAIYRHFESKTDILVAAAEVGDAIIRDGVERAKGLDADERLDCLVRCHVEAGVERGQAIVIWDRDRQHLPAKVRRSGESLRRELQDSLVELVREFQPEVAEADAIEVVNVVLSVGRAAPLFKSRLSPTARIERLVEINKRLVRG